MIFVKKMRNGLPRGSTDFKIPNPAKVHDKIGRLIRWERRIEKQKPHVKQFELCED